jgi:hypothetical protein
VKPISEIPFLRQYDKLIAVIVLIGLVISLFYLTSAGMNRQRDEAAFVDRIARLAPEGEPLKPVAMANYADAVSQAKNPPKLNPPAAGEAGFLTPEWRVMCVEESCRKPIPFVAESCPFCGKKQPPKPNEPVPGRDSDGDGIPDEIELKYGLNPNDPADGAADLDGDGFSNLAEYLAKTDMNDPKSHPPLMDLLRLQAVQSVKIPFIFTGLNKMPDGKLQMTFNVEQPRRTFWVKEGEDVGDTGWVAIGAEQKFEKRKVPGMGDVTQTVEISTVVVRRKSDGKEVTLRINEGRQDTDVEALIVLPLDNSEYRVVQGGTFKLREETYRVLEVNKEAPSVTVESESTGKQKVITKLD